MPRPRVCGYSTIPGDQHLQVRGRVLYLETICAGLSPGKAVHKNAFITSKLNLYFSLLLYPPLRFVIPRHTIVVGYYGLRFVDRSFVCTH